MQDLKITTIQADLRWEDIDANLTYFDSLITQIEGDTDVIVLPEMFTTGFTMNAETFAEPMNGKTMQWMATKAQSTNAVVTGSIIIREGNKFYNRLIWMQPDGSFSTYDKRHLFAMSGEDKVYTAGTEKLILTWKGWTFCPQICYDLRFPVFARNIEDYDVLIFIANWPDKRNFHWKALLTARAIENQAYVVGVNRCGKDGVGFKYSGDTSIISSLGGKLYEVSYAEGVHTEVLSKEQLTKVRDKLPFLADRDTFEIK